MLKRCARILLATALLLTAISDGHVSMAQHFCAETVECLNGTINTCIKTPTSLPSVNASVAGDWYLENAGSHCGAAKCYVFLVCECGPPLSSRLCTSAEKGSA